MFSRLSRTLISKVETLYSKHCLSTSASIPSALGMGVQDSTSQSKLPRLPIPPLHPSLEKYLLSVRPLLSEDEYHQTENIVKEFGSPGGLGVKLHNMLKDRARNRDNWLDEWWLNNAYLCFRMPLVVHSSPGLVFPIKNFANKEKQLRYAARLIAGALNYKMLIDKNILPPDTMGGQPIDMSQYFKIFSTCRLPGIPSDNLIFNGLDPDPPRHIIVVHNNHYFSVDVYGSDGTPLNESQLLSQLESVVHHSQHDKKPIGVLTTQHRDNWAKAYKRLRKYDNINKESIKIIQRSIFLVCLDKAVPEEAGNLNRKTHVALQTVHGGGGSKNSGNRWFDKTIQFIVGADGAVGLSYEHSPAEGPPITSMMDHIVDYIQKTKGDKWLPSAAATEPKKLKFNLSEETSNDIEEAERDLDSIVKDLEMSCFTYDVYGKEFVKSQRLSPDSYIQMAIQLAFYRLYNRISATYESASTRKFLSGRTEVIRSASMEALNFCKTVYDKGTGAHIKAAALRTAVDAHKEYTIQAINGMGIDRLLLGLKLIAVENGINVPELFMDAGYTASTHFRLSTSQVPSKVDAFMCYGPLVPDGYGCCYNPLPNAINFGLSAYNSSPETDSRNFMNALIDSLTTMHDILRQTQQSKL